MTAAGNLPDYAAIRADLEFMTAGWDVLPRGTYFELRAFAEDGIPYWDQFTPSRIAEAVAWAAEQNAQGRNVYAVRNPIRADHRGSANDASIIAAFLCWADCDDRASTDNVRRFEGPRWNAAVTTGRTPDPRVHLYWRLTQPTADLAAWRATQSAIAAHLGSDRTVVNPSRIMRVGGTISYPAAHKRERGYVSEVCTLRTVYEDERPPVELERLARVFGAQPASAAERPQDGGLHIDTGGDYGPALDRAMAAASIQSGNHWRDNVKSLVCSYVARGWTDDEIIARCDAFTLAGYTVAETRKDVAAFVKWAREQEVAKGGRYGASPEHTADAPAAARPDVPAEAPFRSWEPTDPASIPARDFIYGNHYIRRFASVTVAPGGLGKSTLVLAECVAMATGLPVLGVTPKQRSRVVYFNAEDPDDEIARRVVALCQHHRIDQRALTDHLFIASGRTTELILASGENGEITEPVFELMERFAAEHAIDVFAFDPLANMTESPETNDVFRRLGKRLSRFADAANASVELVHHTRKLNGKEAEIEDSRGGGALIGAVRAGRVLNPMTADEAAKAGLSTHIDHFRIEAAGKNNLARPSDKAVWLQKVSIDLANGDHVASIAAWEWPDAFDGITPDMARRVQLRIGAMDPPPKASPQSKAWGGYVVADVLGWDADDKQARARINGMIRAWIKHDVIRIENVHSARDGREIPVFVTGATIPGEEA